MIVLDTDITFATDVGELWQLFRLFTAKQVGACAAMCFDDHPDHLRCDVGLEEGNIEKTVSVLQYCVLL